MAIKRINLENIMPITKGHILCDSIYINRPEQAICRGKAGQGLVSRGERDGERRRGTASGHGASWENRVLKAAAVVTVAPLCD